MPYYEVQIIYTVVIDKVSTFSSGLTKRTLNISAPTMSHLNGIVQNRMMEEGFERDDWKILGYAILNQV